MALEQPYMTPKQKYDDVSYLLNINDRMYCMVCKHMELIRRMLKKHSDNAHSEII